ncbi:hypothetical protein GCM10011380_31410 [Sphingomonas metalli]|uniref:Uncharacterized protein n=1 Tax=Sphingomonas metalli TaxID=1779358 RepID=A0A916TC53_9SPHN|nr:hypothetical protein [Sphingomonas metalli]GGB39605.1 hypothetical protein GCM10011380_31410 [Sphingomonas metalli]
MTAAATVVAGGRVRGAHQFDFHALLDGAAEPPPSPAPGLGQLTVTDAQARLQLGLSRRKLRTLVAAGALIRPAPGHVALEADATCASVFASWTESYEPSATRAAVRRFTDVRDACAVRDAEQPPARVLLAAGAVLAETGGVHRPEELAALLRMPSAAARSAAARLARLIGTPWDADVTMVPVRPWTMDMVVAAVPALTGAPATCLDSDAREHHEEPGDRSRARLAATAPVTGPAALFAIVAAASARREERLEHHMVMVQRFAHWLRRLRPGAGHRDEQAIEATLEHIAFSPELDGAMPPGVRDMVCRTWLLLTDVTERYARGVDPDGVKCIMDLVPARHPDQSGFRKRLLDHFRDLRSQARENRKERSDPLADALTDKVARFWERMEQIGSLCDAAYAARDRLLANRDPDAPPYEDFLVRIPVLDDNGRLLSGHPDGHIQEERWRAWLTDALRESLGLPAVPVQDTLAIDGVEKAPDAPRVMFERLGARAVAGGRTVKPFLVTLSDCGAMARPTGLDRRMLRRRQTILRTWRLPASRSLPQGLMWFDEADEAVWRRAIARRRSMVPLEQFETGALFAELGCNAVLESLCRGGAFMQMERSAEGWPTDDSGERNAGLCFAAIEKTAAGKDPEFVHLPVLDQTIVDAMSVAARVSRAAGRTDGSVPDVLIEERYRWKRPHERPFIFQWNGQALKLTQVCDMLRLLFANIADATFHDFRHACAADLFELCRSPEIVQRALGQTSGVWRHYARQTARMRRREQRRRQQEKEAALADRHNNMERIVA